MLKPPGEEAENDEGARWAVDRYAAMLATGGVSLTGGAIGVGTLPERHRLVGLCVVAGAALAMVILAVLPRLVECVRQRKDRKDFIEAVNAGGERKPGDFVMVSAPGDYEFLMLNTSERGQRRCPHRVPAGSGGR